jgi:hypothetical protein
MLGRAGGGGERGARERGVRDWGGWAWRGWDWGNGGGDLQPVSPIPFLACMLATAQAYRLPPRLLPSIQQVEGGAEGMARRNANGSEDFGVMQVNSIWLPVLAARNGMAPEAVRRRLIADGCFNIAAAGMVMRAALDEAGGDLLRAVGYYHSHTPDLAATYRARVLGAAHELFAARR